MIAKHDLDQLLNQARVSLVGSSDGGLKGMLYDVMSEFLNDSSSWTEDVTVAYQAQTQSYPVSVSEGQIIRLGGVTDWGSTVPTPATPTPPSATPVPALMAVLGTLTVQNPPQNSGYFLVSVVKNVALPTDKHMMPQGPDWLLPVWHVGLLDGLLGNMMMQPSKSYSNTTTAAYHLKRFRDAIARARVAKLRANTVGATAWRFPQAFRTSTQHSGVPASGSGNERTF